MAERVEPEEGRGRTVRQLQRVDVDGVHGDVILMHAVSRGRGRAEAVLNGWVRTRSETLACRVPPSA